MANRVILLVEDNPSDEELTLRAFKQGHILNEVIVVRDGEEALGYLFGTGRYSGRNVQVLPQVMLLVNQLAPNLYNKAKSRGVAQCLYPYTY